MTKELIPNEIIESKILIIRNKKVILDRDLAILYDVETKYLNRQVRRNIERFPEGFIIPLTKKEKTELVTNWHRFEALKHSATISPANKRNKTDRFYPRRGKVNDAN